MNKKSIWGIIGLMTIALLGIMVLQAYWINWSIKLNAEQFDKGVFTTLTTIAQKIELDEINTLPKGQMWSEELVIQALFGRGTTAHTTTTHTHTTTYSNCQQNLEFHNNDCDCFDCQTTHVHQAFNAFIMASGSSSNRPLRDRINIMYLDSLIERELAANKIETAYNYGVYSRELERFILTNNDIRNECPDPQVAKAGLLKLYNSQYGVNLFPIRNQHPPGRLLVHFPNKAGFMWQSVLPTLLGSILFTSIILFCFAYTIQVIFRQKKVSEIKNDFINNMTHEFKTPIATISLAADAISSPMISGNSDKVKRFANIIKEENKRMNKQVEKVLQMALLDKKEFSMDLMRDVDVHEIIDRAVGHLSLQVEQKEGRITTDLRALEATIKTDETHLSNVIHNLLDNANKYSPGKPDISVHTRNVTGGIQIMVKDKGIGMTKEARKQIFNKFYRVHTGNLHDVKGFGLGLSYVKAMMDAHGGRIDVKSELGKGSQFILFFPFEQSK